MKNNIGIIVLNYLAYEETKKLVQQFINLPTYGNNIQIVVIDNDSNNESYSVLSRSFDNFDNIFVFKTDRNLGFANGNNFGYMKLKEIMDPDFVIFSNSDIVIKEKDLFKWLIDTNEKYHYGILGPSIYSLKYNIFQNPCTNWPEDLKYNYLLLIRLKLQLFKLKLNRLFPRLESKNTNWLPKSSTNHEVLSTNKTLHGAFLIMTKKYISQFDTPFDSGTFLYMEEAIIKIRCERKNIPMIYNPTYEVNHLQAVSTQKVTVSSLKRQIIRKKNEINSLKRFIQILRDKV